MPPPDAVPLTIEMIDVTILKTEGEPGWQWRMSFAGKASHSSGMASSKAEAYALVAEVFRGLAEVRRVRDG